VVPGLKPKGAGRFYYPRHGYGQISEALHRAALDAGAAVKLGTTVSGVAVEAGRVVGVHAQNGVEPMHLAARQVLSTVPLPLLVRLIRPEAPADVLAAAGAMQYRAMILIYLVLETERFTEYDAHYFPEAAILITRLSEPKNYSLAECPGTTVLCAELPCSTDDAVWRASDPELGELVLQALAKADLPVRVPVRQVTARRLSHAYPIYTRDYRRHFDVLDHWVAGIDGLLTLGRQGLFAHDNTHHTLAMAYAASACLGRDGEFDRVRWAEYRRHFETHVVED
jgi:protoporphyrinogen oxidase